MSNPCLILWLAVVVSCVCNWKVLQVLSCVLCRLTLAQVDANPPWQRHSHLMDLHQ